MPLSPEFHFGANTYALLWSVLSSGWPFPELALLISVWKAPVSKTYWPILLPLLLCAMGYCGVLSGLTEVKRPQYRAKLILVFFKWGSLKWEGVCWRCRIDRLGSWFLLPLTAIWICAGGIGVFHTAVLVSFLNCMSCLQKGETFMILLCLAPFSGNGEGIHHSYVPTAKLSGEKQKLK